jgi:hypothetical protein
MRDVPTSRRADEHADDDACGDRQDRELEPTRQ